MHHLQVTQKTHEWGPQEDISYKLGQVAGIRSLETKPYWDLITCLNKPFVLVAVFIESGIFQMILRLANYINLTLATRLLVPPKRLHSLRQILKATNLLDRAMETGT